jgi:hypothetical protein
LRSDASALISSQKKAQQEIALQILEQPQNFELDFNSRIEQIYDNSGNMAGKYFYNIL